MSRTIKEAETIQICTRCGARILYESSDIKRRIMNGGHYKTRYKVPCIVCPECHSDVLVPEEL